MDKKNLEKAKKDLKIIFFLLFFIVSIFFLIFGPYGYVAYKKAEEKYAIERKKLDVKIKRKYKMKKTIDELKKDPDAYKKEIDHRYNTVPKEGKDSKYYYEVIGFKDEK